MAAATKRSRRRCIACTPHTDADGYSLCFWSNLVMLVPASLALQARMPFVAFMLLYCMTASMYYHLDESNYDGFVLDISSVVGTIASLAFLLLRFGMVLNPLLVMMALYGPVALYYFLHAAAAHAMGDYDEYEIAHSAWHIAIAAVQVIVVYACTTRGTPLTRPLALWVPRTVFDGRQRAVI